MTIAIVIVRRVARDESAFEGSKSLTHIDEGVGTCVAWECLREEPDIDWIGDEDLQKLVALLVQAQLYGVVIEERSDGLIFELRNGWVGPVEDSEPGYICEWHDAARVRLAGNADGHRKLVGEAVFLNVAG